MNEFQKIGGACALAFGFFLTLVALGDLVFRLCIGLVGVYLINYGLRCFGKASVQSRVTRMMYRRWW